MLRVPACGISGQIMNGHVFVFVSSRGNDIFRVPQNSPQQEIVFTLEPASTSRFRPLRVGKRLNGVGVLSYAGVWFDHTAKQSALKSFKVLLKRVPKRTVGVRQGRVGSVPLTSFVRVSFGGRHIPNYIEIVPCSRNLRTRFVLFPTWFLCALQAEAGERSINIVYAPWGKRGGIPMRKGHGGFPQHFWRVVNIHQGAERSLRVVLAPNNMLQRTVGIAVSVDGCRSSVQLVQCRDGQVTLEPPTLQALLYRVKCCPRMDSHTQRVFTQILIVSLGKRTARHFSSSLALWDLDCGFKFRTKPEQGDVRIAFFVRFGASIHSVLRIPGITVHDIVKHGVPVLGRDLLVRGRRLGGGGSGYARRHWIYLWPDDFKTIRVEVVLSL